MAMLWLYRLLFVCVLLASTEVHAQDFAPVFDITIRPGSCTSAHTVSVPFSALTAEKSNLIGRCVRLHAFTFAGALYPSVAGFYRAGDMSRDTAPGRADRIGLYGVASLLNALGDGGLHQVEVIGRLSDCDQQFFVGGYCHYAWKGRFLVLSAVRRLGGAQARLTSDRLRGDIGDLVAADFAPQETQVITAAGREWLRQIREGDVKAFSRAYADQATELLNQEDSGLYAVFRDPTSVFARARNAPTDATFKLFRLQMAPWIEIRTEDKGEFRAIGCICLVGDCEGRWPIAKVDADNSPNRPYACFYFIRMRHEETLEDEVRTVFRNPPPLGEPPPSSDQAH